MKKKRTRKTSKPNPNGNFVSPLLRQDGESAVINQKVAFNFPTMSKQADNSNGNDHNSSLFREETNGGVILPHSLLVQPENEFMVTNSKMPFTFTATKESSKETEAVIPTEGKKPLISPKPINELLEVPLEPLHSSSKKQKKDDMVIEESLSKLQVESRSTNDQINVFTVETKVDSDLVKNEPKIINSESSSSESSSSEDDDVELCKVPTIDHNVIVLDSESEDENVNVVGADKEEDENVGVIEIDNVESEEIKVSDLVKNDQKIINSESSNLLILLDDSVVDRMNLSQELEKRFQSKKVLLDNCQNQIFVGNLPSSMKMLHVSKFFERYGNITDLKFIRSKRKKTTICFITYEDPSSVNSSLEANGLLYCGHNFRVARVGRFPVIVDCTIMVTNLPDETTIQNLYDVFETCGLIKSQYLEKTKGKLLAYITFELQISAAYAVISNNFVLNGRQIYVHQYKNQRETQGLSSNIT